MSNKVIGDYNAAVSIDGSTHYLLIQPGDSSTAYNKITRNVYLGVNGQPVDISTSQTLSNKVISNTNTLAVKDTLFTLQDDGDTTKQAQFQLSGITTATTRTYTLPNASSTLADIATAQTFTNKTLTAPVINNGSITGTTITTDAIVGQSASTNGTIYGLSVASSKVGTNGVVTNSITDNSVTASKLAINAVTLGYAQITSPVTNTSTGGHALITGLSTTVTIPAGGRNVKITVGIPEVFNSSATTTDVSIWNGTVGSGTMLQSYRMNTTGDDVDTTVPMTVVAVVLAPGVGSVTYKAGMLVGAGTGTAFAAATSPAFILVEAI